MGNKGVIGSGAEPAGWRTRAFFEYWRQRAAFIEALSLPAHVHEANVLVWAALDALANLWAGQPGQPQLGHRSAFGAFLARYGGEPFQRVEAWLHRSRFGSIAYKRLRSAFIHEGRPGKDTHSFQLHGSATNVTYLSPRFATPAVLGFAPTFMVSALRRCIDAFEQDALERNLDPVPRG